MTVNLSRLQNVTVESYQRLPSVRFRNQATWFELVPRMYITYPTLRCHQGPLHYIIAQLVAKSV